MKLSTQEKTDLDKFIKFWALKSAQIIVQSRLGDKASIPSNPQTTVDWVSPIKAYFIFISLSFVLV